MELTSTAERERQWVVMPAFAGGTHAYVHNINSALESLAALGIAANRVMLRRRGRSGEEPGTVLSQKPAAGTPLSPDRFVELDIAGLGFTHALPVGMWDSGGEAAAGTREILEPFDDPLEKLKHWFHEGAPLFRISPEDPQACVRWLALFGVRAAAWPQPMWFRLASLISRMAQLSCSQGGCAFVLETLLGLPVKSFTYVANEAKLSKSTLSGLGSQASLLGVDLLMGDRVEDLAKLHLELGPVTLATYERFVESKEGAALLRQTLELVMPCTQPYEIGWAVGDWTQPPQLGLAAQNARLGINTHMGGAMGIGASVIESAVVGSGSRA